MDGSQQQLMSAQPVLTTEQLQREMDYRAAMDVLKLLRRESVLTEREARRIKQKMTELFSPVWAGIA